MKLVRGCSVVNNPSPIEAGKVKLNVQLDGAQYKMDMMHLAVEDSMFVEESYAACQAVIKMPSQAS